jgi:hypothetical protein
VYNPTSQRRINRLHLKIPDEGDIHRAVVLLEDAFNVASLPGIPPNGLMLVRHFDLGFISHFSSSAAISQQIDARIRVMAGSAKRIDDEDLNGADVVWFEDALSPYLALAGLIARGRPPGAWYWQKAVPSWNPTTKPYRAILDLIQGAVETSGKAIAPALVLDRLVNLGREERLLGSMTQQHAEALFKLADIHPRDGPEKNAVSDPVVSLMSMGSVWQRALERWIARWGPRDNRSLWLMVSAIQCHNPAQIDGPHLVATARPSVAVIHRNGFRSMAFRKKASAPDRSGRSQNSVHPAGDSGSHGATINDRQQATEPNPSSEASAIAHFSKKRRFEKQPAVPEPYPMTKGPDPGAEPTVQLYDEAREQTAPNQLRKGKAAHDGRFASTHHAGFLFLVGVLSRLGIEEILRSQPQFADVNLPAHLLWALVEHLHLAVDDPVCSFLPGLPEVDGVEEFDFVAPQPWMSLLDHYPTNDADRVLRLSINDRKRKILSDNDTGVVLAVWGEQRPRGLDDWLRAHKIISDPIRPASDFDDIITAFLDILGIYLERRVNMDVRTLVNRQGVVATTKTHVDVLLVLKHADIRIRAAGLDIDPGWVPWLGRVVQYHYQEERIHHV